MRIDLSQLSPAAQAQIARKLAKKNAERLAAAQAEKQNQKFHNKPDIRGNIKFDSKKEARRYDELMLRLQAGQIEKLKLQKQFTLQESYVTPDGERIRAIRYVADFSYIDCATGLEVVEDVKSRATKTDKYKIKKKLMQEIYSITIVEI